jgi:hypothetical protein
MTLAYADSAVYYYTVVAEEQVGGKVSSYVPINGTSKSVYKDFAVRYKIRVWKVSPAPYKNISGRTKGAQGDNDWAAGNDAWPLTSQDGINVVLLDSWKTSVDSIVRIGSVEQSDVRNYNGSVVTTIKYDFDVIFTSKKPGTITPKFQVKLIDTSPGVNGENFSGADLQIAIKPGTVMPTINFTAAKVEGPKPKEAIVKANTKAENVVLNTCATPNEWVAFGKTGDINPIGINYFLYFYSLEGKILRSEWIGYDNTQGTGTGPDKISHYRKGIERLLEYKVANCEKVVVKDPGPGSSSFTEAEKSGIIYNPPSHYVTRGMSHGMRVSETFTDPRIDGSIVIDASKTAAGANDVFNQFKSSRNSLGRIYQTKSTSISMNTLTPPRKTPPVYGFKFTYNPTSFRYETAMNTAVDWTMNSSDPANLIGGNVSVNFTLYLNRIADMTELKDIPVGQGTSKNYPEVLSPEAVQGILKRGTEYDLEFLYRVVNGSPKSTSLLTYPGVSSDFGYVTGAPVWFEMHENLRYYGSLANLSVEHVLFTQSMVPMLSVVTITFLRYPSTEGIEDALKSKAKKDIEAFNVDPTVSKTLSTGTKP